MRVLHVQKVKGIGGSERHLLSLLPGLRERGADPVMCVLAAKGADPFVDAMRAEGIDTLRLAAGPDVNPILLPQVARALARTGADLVHTHLFHGDSYGLMAARLLHRPAVSSVHSVHGMYRRQPYRSFGVMTSGAARRTIAISAYVRRFLIDSELRHGDRIRVVPYGIASDDWATSDQLNARARKAFGLNDGDVAIGMAARLIPGKGHGVLVEAFEQAVASAPSLRLLIAGDGPLRSDLETAVRRLPSGAARVLGFIPDIRSFMAACDVLAFPTSPQLGEGFGLAALEAMASSRPVIATDVASLPEVVANGETGLLVQPDDPSELAGALLELASDSALRHRLGQQARARAVERFGLDRMISETLAVYDEALA